jgi:hypothetical protein
MLLKKVEDLVLALNIKGIDVSLISDTRYSRKYMKLFKRYKLTIWETKVINHKRKSFPAKQIETYSLREILVELANTIREE